MTSARSVALDALVRIDDGAFSHVLVPQLLARSDLAGRDRAWVTAFVYGTVRMQRVLDGALGAVSSRPLRDLEPPVRAALRLGAYQLFEGVPPHAAVAETVGVVAPRARPFVNGVLRSLARTSPRWPVIDESTPDRALGPMTSHPDWLVAMLLHQFDRRDVLAMLQIDNAPPNVTLRPNPMRTTAGALIDELRAGGIDAERGALVEDAIVLDAPRDPGALAAVREGCASPQDQASQAVVQALDPQPGDRIADLAAAPGGKATAAAERMHDEGLVVAADVHSGRVQLVARAAKRLGLQRVGVIAADGREPPLRPRAFDRVLLDAPCSGLGVLRRRPDARFRITPRDVDTLAALQRELLRAAAELVRTGGRLVYSVCTVSDAETVAVDRWASEALAEFTPLPAAGAPWRPRGRGALLLPHDAGTDGMFVLVLERTR